MATPKAETWGERVGRYFYGLVVGALVVGFFWLILLFTNNPIAQIVLGHSTGFGSGEVSGDVGPPIREPVESEPTDAEIADAMRGAWSCYYDPTMNDDWHDDVVCTNGVESERPILLDGQFVTQADMEAAAAEYEGELNGR